MSRCFNCFLFVDYAHDVALLHLEVNAHIRFTIHATCAVSHVSLAR